MRSSLKFVPFYLFLSIVVSVLIRFPIISTDTISTREIASEGESCQRYSSIFLNEDYRLIRFSDLFRELKKIQKDSIYIQTKGSIHLREVNFIGHVENSTKFMFEDVRLKHQFELDAIEIVSVVPKNSIVNSNRFKWLSNLELALSVLQISGESHVLPFKKLVKGIDLEIVGKSRASRRETAEMILNQINEFDQAVEVFGLKKIVKTVVVLNDKPFFSSAHGPFFFIMDIWNPWFKGRSRFLYLNAVGEFGFNEKSESVVWHERAHDLLYSNFKSNSFVNEDPTIQEALADFMAAFVSGSPKIGEHFIYPGTVIRNIDTRLTHELKEVHLLTGLSEDYHSNSLLISNLLWNLQSRMDEKEFIKFFNQFVDNLNGHYVSFLKTLDPIKGHFVYDEVSERIRLIEYAYSMAYLSADQLKINPRLKNLIIENMEDVGFVRDRIFLMNRVLVNDGENYRIEHVENLTSWKRYAYVTGGGVLLVASEAAYVGVSSYVLTRDKKQEIKENKKVKKLENNQLKDSKIEN